MDRPQRDRHASDGTPEGIPRAAVAAWAAGSHVPGGKRGKKTRRRVRKIAAALATILVMTSAGTTAALAEASFYEASPYVDNRELVEAGSKTYDGQLAIGQPESTEEPAIAARTLEDAIVSGGLSPDDMEMPDMMLAGISGDQMALAAAEDDDVSPGVGPAATPDGEEPTGALAEAGVEAGADEDAEALGETAGKGPAADATVEGLAKDAAQENPDGYASPALGGDPEPIVEEYAAASDAAGDAEEPADPAPADGAPAPSGVELASADPGEDTPGAAPISDSGTSGAAPTTEPVAEQGATEPEEAQSDELAYTPASGDDASEAPAHYAPEDSGESEEPAMSPPAADDPEDDSGAELASAEDPSSEDPSSEDPSSGDAYAYPPDLSGTAGYSEAPPEHSPPEQPISDEVPPEQAVSDEAPAADAPRPYAFQEEEADDYVQGTPPDHSRGTPPEHSSASEHAADEPGEAQEEGPEPGPQHQMATVALFSEDQGAPEDAPPEIGPEAPPEEPPGQEIEQDQGQGGEDLPSEEAEGDAAGADQTFSGPEGTVEDRPVAGGQPQGAGPQDQEDQSPEDDTPPPYGQAGGSEPASAPEEVAAEGDAGGNAEGGARDGATPEGDSGTTPPAFQGGDRAPARPAGDATAQDRPQRPQQQRDPAAPGDRAPESQQSPPRPEGAPEKRPEPQPGGTDGNTHGRPAAAHRSEPGAQDGPGTRTFAEPEAPSSERAPDRAAGDDEPAPSDELRASPTGGAGRTPPVWDREGLPEDERPQDRRPEGRAAARQPAPAQAEQAREDRRAERQADLQAQRRADRRVELQAVREDRRAERRAEREAAQQAELRADRGADRRADRQAELREARRAERVEAGEVAAQEAAAQEAADGAALLQQRRAERSAADAAAVQGFADQTQPRGLPGGGGQRWDAPAVEPSLPAPKAHRWANTQPVEPVIAEPAYQKPAPVRTPGAAAGGFDPAPRVAADPVAAETPPLPARQIGGGGGGLAGNAGGTTVNNPVGSPVGNPAADVGGGGAVDAAGAGGGGAAGAPKGVMR